jgi:CHAT domain-containing protein/Tfp pilus assembly protein PilF
VLFLFLFPLKDTKTNGCQTAYDHAWSLFQHGRLADSQRDAEQGYQRFLISNPDGASKFQLLEAESMVWRGAYDDALQVLAKGDAITNPEDLVRKLTIEATALTHQEPVSAAEDRLTQATSLCEGKNYPTCGDVISERGILAMKQGLPERAKERFLGSILFAQAHHDRWLEAASTVNLGWAALQVGHFDEAVDWSKVANQDAVNSGAEDLAQISSGNLGWAYLQLGDDERALEQFLQAEKSAEGLGDFRRELRWITAAGYVYRDTGNLPRATQSYHQAFELAKRINSTEDIVNALEDLAQVSVDAGRLDEADTYIAQVTSMESAGGGRLSANVLLTEGMLAAARHQNQQAESLFHTVQSDAKNPTTTRLGAGQQLARLYEAEGDPKAAERMYKTTLSAFDTAQADLKSEESKLPFVANAARIYDDYIHLLLEQGRSDEALAVADQSRARTLAQSLGVGGGKNSLHAAALDPRQVARKTGATLLFYWLGPKQSCLWAITPAKIAFYPLPSQSEIVARVDRYRKAILDTEYPLQAGNMDGQALYQILIAPAAKIIRSDAPVMILADGVLSQLNFETLLVPGASSIPAPNAARASNQHYWIDDATVLSAPSLAMLAAAKPVRAATRNLLLLGNPVSPSDDFPTLPLFGYEMKNIEKHFDTKNVSIFASQQATPAAYLTGKPAQYAYIHFVSHAVSSRTDPLDSAIILSNATGGTDTFKLYARDIMKRPIDARLVTISACNGSGTRSYAGEGLVGLSWAFLHAGAHSVIGALWEASDDSTPRLMDKLYDGLENGQTPAAALRQAKLSLLHSNSKFQQPFFWAPFQIYSSQ